MITYTIRTDVKGKRTLETDAVFTTGDVQAYRLRLVFYDNGVYDATGCSLMVKGKRPDGVVVIDEGVIDELGNAFYDVKSSMYAVAGKLSLEVALLTKDGGYLTVKELTISVREGFGEGELAEDAKPFLTELHDTLAEAKEITEKARPVADIVAAEELRNKREEQRLQSETERVAAELQREEAEAERIAAEAERQEAYGQMNNTFGSALKGSASGSVIFMDDVSPVEHSVGVQLTSDTITDFSSVTLKRNGKNLVNSDSLLFTSYGGVDVCAKNEDGSYNMIKTDSNRFSGRAPIFVKSGCKITISLDIIFTDTKELYCRIIDTDGNSIPGTKSLLSGGIGKKELVWDITKDTARMEVYYQPNAPDGVTVFKDFQVEIGDTATEYEPYNEKAYAAKADGTVDGVTSLAPTMSLFTNNSDAVIEASYNKDSNKVIEKLTNAIISLGGNV